jgi:hypothetical protein
VEFGSVWISTKAAPDGTFRIRTLPSIELGGRFFASEVDGNRWGDFRATPGGDPVTLSPERTVIPATPR